MQIKQILLDYLKRVCLGMLAASPLLAQTALQSDVSRVLQSPEDVRRYLVQHPRDVALANFSVTADGTIETRDPVILHNADKPMPLASVLKIVLLAAYARAVAAGQLNPQEPVTMADWERYYLPGRDSDAHAKALTALGLAIDLYGFAVDQAATVPLDAMVGAMIQFSDNAAPDWLLVRLGNAVPETMQVAGMRGQEPLLSPLGMFLAWENHEVGALTEARLWRLLLQPQSRYVAEINRLRTAFQQPDWRAAEFEWRLAQENLGSTYYEKWLAQRTTKGTVRDYAMLLARVVTGNFLSPEISATMRRHLEWPLQEPALRNAFAAFGNKGGTLAGVVTDANFYIPRSGDFAGQSRVSVLFLQQMPLVQWQQLTETFAQQRFNAELAVNRIFAQQVARSFSRW